MSTKPVKKIVMEQKHTEGIVIRVFPFRDRDRILALFTPQEGLIRFVVKGALSAKQGKGSFTTPLNLIEAIYTQGRSELYTCHEVAVLDTHQGLRHNLKTLEAACEMLKCIEATQCAGKSAPELYALLRAYLKRLPDALDPGVISSSFRLKTLHYEGVLSGKELFKMTSDELQLVEVLTLCRDFSLLAKLTIDPSFAMRISQFFNHCFS